MSEEKLQLYDRLDAGELSPDDLFHVVAFKFAELRDFGRYVGIIVTDCKDRNFGLEMSRTQAQDLFDKLWDFYFRPTDKQDG